MVAVLGLWVVIQIAVENEIVEVEDEVVIEIVFQTATALDHSLDLKLGLKPVKEQEEKNEARTLAIELSVYYFELFSLTQAL